MSLDKPHIEEEIKAKIVELAAKLDMDASALASDEIIPAAGLVDSAALLELLVWFEQHYNIDLPQEDVTIDNLGSLALMADYVLTKRGATDAGRGTKSGHG